jgi:hypothetical protein
LIFMPPIQPIPVAPDANALIERCLQGDQLAWDGIVRMHWRKVFNVAYKFVGRHDEAEDLAQEIFLKIFKSLATFDRRANFQTWLISVSRNLCIARNGRPSTGTSTPMTWRPPQPTPGRCASWNGGIWPSSSGERSASCRRP